MKLDSVRELKQRAVDTVLQPMLAAGPRALGLSYAAAPRAVLRATPRVLALGVAPGNKAGEFKLAVRLQRRSLHERDELARLHELARGEIDVRFVGRVHKRAAATAPWHQQPNRPLRIGGSIAHVDVTAGTVGGFVRTRGRDDLLILSNNHVLADENRGRRGDPVLQPGWHDGGRPRSAHVADLQRYVRLRPARVNRTDCAVARVHDGLDCDPSRLTGLGRLRGVLDAVPVDGLRVAKVGRTTGVTRGRVTAFELDDVVVAYDIGNVRFDDQIEIESTGSRSFSDGGDSGSLIVDRDGHAVAQLFAGSDSGGRANLGLTYATPIQAVLDALDVDLLV